MNKILFVIGILLCLLPFGLQRYEKEEHSRMVDTYVSEMEQSASQELEKMFREAQEYNRLLWDPQNGVVGKEYQSLLNPSRTGLMGSIEIPKIDVKLPIYHGTEESTLSNGIGHLKGSSLPVGGENTHCILSGHRGLPNAELFTRLDELKKGDLFLIYTCNQTLTYQVSEIQIVEPENTEILGIQSEKDLVSLITCTPYGINTHRLVVTGERVVEVDNEMETVISEKAVNLKWLFLSMTVICFLIAIKIRSKKRRCP